MPPAFTKAEYDARLAKVRAAMAERDLDALVVGDPNNHNWLTGYDAWSFYTPQIVVVRHDADPVWIGRKMDAGAHSLGGRRDTSHMGRPASSAASKTCAPRPGDTPKRAPAATAALTSAAVRRVPTPTIASGAASIIARIASSAAACAA